MCQMKDSFKTFPKDGKWMSAYNWKQRIQKELQEKLKKIIEAKQLCDSWKTKDVENYSIDDRVQEKQWYRLSGMQDFINYILGKIELSNDSRFEVREIFGENQK